MGIERVNGMESINSVRESIISSERARNTPDKPHGKSGEVKRDSATEENRESLLKRVRSRVKSGYYDSDAVIDDIGHGFADLLNSYMQ